VSVNSCDPRFPVAKSVAARDHVSIPALVVRQLHDTGKARGERRRRSIVKVALWIAQVLLALAFGFAGSMKLILPGEALTALYPFPEMFIRFIGVCELLGVAGLILPGLPRIRQGRTPLAAAGLATIMAGATATTLVMGGGASALMPLALGVLAVFVVFGRTWLGQLTDETPRRPVLKPAG
jgi:hypothetical protein